jgi:hypothetical protein
MRQAKALERFAREAKSLKPLDPAAKALAASLASVQERNPKWMLLLNKRVESLRSWSFVMRRFAPPHLPRSENVGKRR